MKNNCSLAVFGFFPPIVYANAIQENMNMILYPGLIEELVDIVEIADPGLVVSSTLVLNFY